MTKKQGVVLDLLHKCHKLMNHDFIVVSLSGKRVESTLCVALCR